VGWELLILYLLLQVPVGMFVGSCIKDPTDETEIADLTGKGARMRFFLDLENCSRLFVAMQQIRVVQGVLNYHANRRRLDSLG
jgi:hypothetical protein